MGDTAAEGGLAGADAQVRQFEKLLSENTQEISVETVRLKSLKRDEDLERSKCLREIQAAQLDLKSAKKAERIQLAKDKQAEKELNQKRKKLIKEIKLELKAAPPPPALEKVPTPPKP